MTSATGQESKENNHQFEEDAAPVELKQCAKDILADPERSKALRNLLTYVSDEIEADEYISECAGEEKLPGGSSKKDQVNSLTRKHVFVSRLYNGRLNKLAACNHPKATEDEKLYYDYWFKLSATRKFGWG